MTIHGKIFQILKDNSSWIVCVWSDIWINISTLSAIPSFASACFCYKNNISTGFNTFSNFSLKLICHLSYFQRQLLADNRYLILIDHPKKYTCFSLHNFFRLNSNWTNFWFYHSILLIFVRTNETIFVGPVKNVQTENERWMFPFATQHTS